MQVEGLQGKDVMHCKLFSFDLVIYALVLRLLSLCGLERGGQEPGCGFFLCTWRILVFNIARLLIYVTGRTSLAQVNLRLNLCIPT